MTPGFLEASSLCQKPTPASMLTKYIRSTYTFLFCKLWSLPGGGISLSEMKTAFKDQAQDLPPSQAVLDRPHYVRPAPRACFIVIPIIDSQQHTVLATWTRFPGYTHCKDFRG